MNATGLPSPTCPSGLASGETDQREKRKDQGQKKKDQKQKQKDHGQNKKNHEQKKKDPSSRRKTHLTITPFEPKKRNHITEGTNHANRRKKTI